MPQPSSQKHIQHGGGGKEECQQSRNVMEVGHHMTTFPGSARTDGGNLLPVLLLPLPPPPPATVLRYCPFISVH